MDVVQRALKHGMIVFARGTTNSYVIEEIMNIAIDKRAYRCGITTPEIPERSDTPDPEQMPDLVLRKGEIVKELDRFSAVREMQRGDVFLKGANALDYKNSVAGILIGGRISGGGDIGNAIGTIVAKKLNLIIPVGLEKLAYHDIQELSRMTLAEDSEGPSMLPVTGIIVTEIEALRLLTGTRATLLASGGVAGAEGAVRLLIEGKKEDVDEALKLVDKIKGEPRYLL